MRYIFFSITVFAFTSGMVDRAEAGPQRLSAEVSDVAPATQVETEVSRRSAMTQVAPKAPAVDPALPTAAPLAGASGSGAQVVPEFDGGSLGALALLLVGGAYLLTWRARHRRQAASIPLC